MALAWRLFNLLKGKWCTSAALAFRFFEDGKRWHGEARLRIEPVPGRLCRPPGICAGTRAFPSLHRASARPDRQRIRSPHVRGNAGLGRGPFRVDPGATRLRDGMAEPAEVGRVALVEISRPQRHTCRG